MAVFRPFNAIRPLPEYASKVAALPYDVMSSEEAREMVKDNLYSFLHVDKAEIDLDKDISPYDEKVYSKAKENLDNLIENNICFKEETPCIYIYRQILNGRSQTGLVGCTSIDDYLNNVIKKHEYTRAEKEQDRINHVDYCDANTGPIFLTYRDNDVINNVVSQWQEWNYPVYDFINDDGVYHTVWVINNKEIIKKIQNEFCKVESLYIADGHHRAASAVKVGLKRRDANPGFSGDEEFNFFLSVAFPSSELHVMDYNRVVKDLNGLSSDEFLDKVKENFNVEFYSKNDFYKPNKKHTFGMYLDKKWYRLEALEDTFDSSNSVKALDVSILQDNLIKPVLGIKDPRSDKRIDFVGGIRGLNELEHRVKKDMKVAFSMYPTTVSELMNIADSNEIMPPKSTWFEPKLLSGLFIHKL